jgi:hypothetical protein
MRYSVIVFQINEASQRPSNRRCWMMDDQQLVVPGPSEADTLCDSDQEYLWNLNER